MADVYRFEQEKATERKSSSSKTILIIGFVFLLMCLAGCIGYIVYLKNNDGTELRRTKLQKAYPGSCSSNTCIMEASRLMQTTNLNADPCEDFYEYACGNFKFMRPLGSKEVSSNTGEVEEFVNARVKDILNAPNKPDDVESHKKARNFYQSCMNYKDQPNTMDSKLPEILNSFGSWPALKSWNKNNKFVLEYQMVKAEQLAVGVFFTTELYINGSDSKATLLVEPIASDAYSEIENKNEDELAYIIEEICNIFGIDDEDEIEEMKNMIQFHESIKNLSVDESILEDGNVEIVDVYKKYPTFDWTKYFQKSLDALNVTYVPGQDILVLSTKQVDPVKNILELIEKTKPNVLSNYFIWRVLMKYFEYTTNDIIPIPTGDEYCIPQTSAYYSYAISQMFTDSDFDDSSDFMIRKMVQQIQISLSNMIRETSWIDKTSQDLIIQKIMHIVARVGDADFVRNSTILDNMYGSADVTNDFFMNMLNVNIQAQKYSFQLYGKVSDRRIWDYSSITVNAFYDGDINEIFMLSGYLQKFMFNRKSPMYLNYGSTGSTIGHELGHSIDSNGIQVDRFGNGNSNWLPDYIQEEYRNKSQCFIDQYDNIRVVRRYLNQTVSGELTLSENIADLIGVKTAYKAYKAQKFPDDKPLPGLGLNIDQLFFVQSVQEYCIISNPDQIDFEDEHTPDRYRANAIIQNSEDFDKTFKCKAGQKMFKQPKCSIL